MDRDTARIIGGLYYAITSALPRETAEQIHQIVGLATTIRTTRLRSEYYRALAATVLELFDDPLERRNRFHVISGGSAA